MVSRRVQQAAMAVAVSITTVIYPDLVPEAVRQSWAPYAAYAVGLGIVVLLLLQGVEYAILVRYRGLTKTLSTGARDRSFERVYTWSKRRLLVWGVAMTKVSQEGPTFKKIAGGGINVTFEMTDPNWVAQQPQVESLLADFYRMPDILSKMRNSLESLQAMALEVNSSSESEGRIEITLVKGFDFSSGTIADPALPTARGVIERHQYGTQTRFAMRHEVRDYVAPWWIKRFSERTSLLRNSLNARNRLERSSATPVSAAVVGAPPVQAETDEGTVGHAMPSGETHKRQIAE